MNLKRLQISVSVIEIACMYFNEKQWVLNQLIYSQGDPIDSSVDHSS